MLTKSHVSTLKKQGNLPLLDGVITHSFPQPWEVKDLDVVVTTIERMGSRVGKRDGTSQNDSMKRMSDGLAQVPTRALTPYHATTPSVLSLFICALTASPSAHTPSSQLCHLCLLCSNYDGTITHNADLPLSVHVP